LNALKLESKLLFELMKTGVDTFSRPLRSKCPSFVSVGSEDRVIGKDDLVKYFSEVDKSFKLTVFDGAYHEIHNEIEKYRKSYFDYIKTVMNEVLFSS
jgi:alpha-beta hydrolase superfamily lysophospholipase